MVGHSAIKSRRRRTTSIGKSQPKKLCKISIEDIKEVSWLPKRCDYGDLAELARSLLARGDVDVPIKVRRIGENEYELIWGHRRLQAAKLAGLTHLTAIIEEVEDEELIIQHFIENLFKKNKNPLEEAELFESWKRRFNRNYDEIAKILGVRRDYIYNRVELFKLHPETRELLKNVRSDTNNLGLYHARLLLKIKDPHTQYKLALEAIREGLTTRELEQRIKDELSKSESETSNLHVEETTRPRLLNLTQKALEDTTVPFGAKVEIIKTSENGVDYRKLIIPTHIATHIDTPHIFFDSGKCIDDYPMEKFMGRAYVIDARKTEPQEITLDDLNRADARQLARSDILLFYTGYAAIFGTEKYYHSHPFIADELADWIIQQNKIKIIGIDLPSPEVPHKLRGKNFTFPIHKKLLANDILIIENVADMSRIVGHLVSLIITPLLLKGLDEVPVSVTAFTSKQINTI